MKAPLNIEEFLPQMKIECITATGHDWCIIIECLGPLGSYIRPIIIPIDRKDYDDAGELLPEVVEYIQTIARRLNASNAPLMPHPATTDGLIPITTPEALSIEEEVARDYQEQMAWQEEVEADGLYIYE